MNGSHVFNAGAIERELKQARVAGKTMVRGALEAFTGSQEISIGHLPFFAFIERAQAFHQGVVDMVESGNPLAAAALLRSFAENVAVVFYIEKNPHEFEKLFPGAAQGLPMGRVVAAAQKRLPGFKDLYAHLSSMTHPSGAGAYQTLIIRDGGEFTWQSQPTFKTADDARQFLRWLEEMRDVSTSIIKETALTMRVADGESKSESWDLESHRFAP